MGRRDFYDDPEAPAPNSLVPAVTAVVVDDAARILLIHRTDNDRWALPGGVLEIGESVKAAAVRETAEETGIDIEVDRLTGVYSDPRHVIAYDDGEVRQQFAICVRGHPTGGALAASSEARAARWVDVQALDSLNIHPTHRLRIAHALDEAATGPYLE